MSGSELKIYTPQGVEELTVSRFRYQGAISRPYVVEWIARVQDAESIAWVKLAQRLPVSFSFCSATMGRSYQIHGVLTQVTSTYDPVEQVYSVEGKIEPRLALLAYSRVIQLFQNYSVEEILEAFLQEVSTRLHPFSYKLMLSETLLKSKLPGLEIQYGSSDLEFLYHLCRYGLFFYFIQGDTGETLVIGDNASQLKVHSEPLQIDNRQRAQVHLDEPIFYNPRTHQRLRTQTVKARFYDPTQPSRSVSQLTEPVQNLRSIEIMHRLDQHDALNQRLTAGLNADRESLELTGHYSRLQVGEHVRVDDQSYWVQALSLTGHFAQQKWGFTTQVTLFPESAVPYGTHITMTRQKLPAHLYGAILQGDQQVDQEGYFRVQFPKAFTKQNPHPPDILLRDLQGTSTLQGGASHSTTYDGEVLLSSANGQSGNWIIAGSLHNANYPSQVTTENEQDTLMQNQGGMTVRLRRKRDNQPHGHLHLGVTDDSQAESFLRLGGHQEPGEPTPHYGMQEGSTGFAKKVIGKHALTQVGNIADPVYRFQHQQQGGKHDIQEHVKVDSYSHRYYTKPLSGDTTAVSQAARKATEAAQQMFPSFSYDLGDFPETLIYSQIFKNNFITITVKPSGTIVLRNLNSINPLELDKSGMRIQAQEALKRVFGDFAVPDYTGLMFVIDNQTLKIRLDAHFKPITPNQYQAEIDSVKIKTKYDSWIIIGQLNFIFKLTITSGKLSDSGVFSGFNEWFLGHVEDPVKQFGQEIGTFLQNHKAGVLRVTFWLLQQLEENIKAKAVKVSFAPNSPVELSGFEE